MNQVATPAPSSSGADFVKSRRSSIIAAIFLMATSAIGPGFITQTATFTTKLGPAFAFGILASVIIDFVVQLNVWRMIALSRRNASALANAALPGSGHVLALLVIFGGLVFNVGNIAGAGLGLSALLGLPAKWGGLISAALAVGIFASSRAGAAVDRLIIWLGLLMIVMTAYVAFVSGPPVGEALQQMVVPQLVDWTAITTIVGGTVGGYITYAGAHRLLDRGTVGAENLGAVTAGGAQWHCRDRGDAFSAVPGHSGRGVQRCGHRCVRQGSQSGGAGLPGCSGRVRTAGLRAGVVGGSHYQCDRGGLYLDVVPFGFQE